MASTNVSAISSESIDRFLDLVDQASTQVCESGRYLLSQYPLVTPIDEEIFVDQHGIEYGYDVMMFYRNFRFTMGSLQLEKRLTTVMRNTHILAAGQSDTSFSTVTSNIDLQRRNVRVLSEMIDSGVDMNSPLVQRLTDEVNRGYQEVKELEQQWIDSRKMESATFEACVLCNDRFIHSRQQFNEVLETRNAASALHTLCFSPRYGDAVYDLIHSYMMQYQ